MIPDWLFLSFSRLAAHGGTNPGRTHGDPAISSRANDTADMASNLPILYGVVQGLFAEGATAEKRVLEIGCNDGTSTLALLKAAAEHGGSVVSIDIGEVPVAQALVDHFGLRPFWTFHHGDSRKVMRELCDRGERFGAIFLDGDHTYEGTKAELAMVDELLVPGGVLFTHDNWCAACDVKWDQPFGARATPGGAQLAKEMIRGTEWCGTIFRFGCNLGIFRRRVEVLAEIESPIEQGRREGFFP